MGDVESILNALLSRQVDGIIWAVSEVGNNRDWLKERLPDLPVPIIFLTMHPQDGLSIVAVDNYRGARMATEHLLEQGYRHIGHITGPMTWEVSRQRLLGWQDSLPGCSPRQAYNGDWSAASGENGLHQLLDQFPELDAIFASNDQTALGALQAAHQQDG